MKTTVNSSVIKEHDRGVKLGLVERNDKLVDMITSWSPQREAEFSYLMSKNVRAPKGQELN